MKPIVIGLLGRAGSGKSTVAKHLVAVENAKIFSFAAPLKNLAQELLQLQTSQLYGTQVQKETIDPRYGFSPRTFMERLGNGARRYLGEAVWRDACFNAILKDYKSVESVPGQVYVVDDVRYPNEAAGLKGEDFDTLIFKLVCPDAITTANPNSETEKCVDTVPEHLIDATIEVSRSEGAAQLIKTFMGHWISQTTYPMRHRAS